MMDIFNSAWDWIVGVLEDAADWVLSVLPDSPFQSLDIEPIRGIIGYIAWFVPVKFILSVLGLWLVAVAGYYIYSIVLRWIKAID